MCGISGFVSSNSIGIEERAAIQDRMNATLVHRGPDDGRVWTDPDFPLTFGHRRLIVLDPTPAGSQPMHSASSRYVLVTNGEIYNHMELREKLLDQGLAPDWKGTGDTETMLACLAAWDLETALAAFHGMFAFALWDRRKKTLTLARDRMGEKSLYYGWQGNTFVFGSELKALKAHPECTATIDRRALSLFMRHSNVPAPYSIYEGINKLKPGHFAVHDFSSNVRNADLPQRAFWKLDEAIAGGQSAAYTGSDEEAIRDLDTKLRAAISRQMLSDVPLGAFLSGGIDSSLVVSLMQAQSSVPIKTFTIGSSRSDINEAKFAKEIAHHLGTDHTELYVSDHHALEVVPNLSELYCEPFADSSQIPTYLVSRLAREQVTVALSGDGGDELFAGYNRYLTARTVWQRIQALPPGFQKLFSSVLLSMSPGTWDRGFNVLKTFLPRHMQLSSFGDKTAKLAQVLRSETDHEFYLDLVSHWKDPSSVVIDGNEPKTRLSEPDQWPQTETFEHWMMAMDTQTYMPDDIFVKVDRASMANSLEVRAPMVSPGIVDFAWSLPGNMRIRDRQGKWLLRQVLYQYVPKQMIERPKMGFGIPLNEWLRGPLRDWAEALIDKTRLTNEGYFRSDPIRTKWDEHMSGARNWQYDLWDVLMFQSWLEGQQNHA